MLQWKRDAKLIRDLREFLLETGIER